MLLLTTLAIALAPEPEPAPAPAPVPPETTVAPADVGAGIDARLPADYVPPFPSDTLELSQVLEFAVRDNIDLRSNAIDTDISEANVLAAQGAYDLLLTAGILSCGD